MYLRQESYKHWEISSVVRAIFLSVTDPMNGSNQNYAPPEYLRTGPDYGGYSAGPGSRNSLSSLFSVAPRGGDPDPRLLFGLSNPSGFLGMSSFPAPPHLQNQTQYFNSDATRNTIPWPPAAIALPNFQLQPSVPPAAIALPNFQPQPSVQGPQDGSKLSQEEQKKVLNRLKKEAYNPVTKLSRRKPNLYYRDNPLTISKELEKEKHEEGKRCAICLEDFEPKEIVTITPCNHMFHEECIVPWVKNEGRCPVCRFAISERFGETAAGSSNVTANDHFGNDLTAIVRAMEEAFVPENMRRFVEFLT
ncbi:uncharacterized protein [Coffea arabica]|uniref:RING-type E3 ubiquitin transferase n=1 Tax=Coffea arabica TaxID=13443 RepID=A0ABM4UIR2_COFAR